MHFFPYKSGFLCQHFSCSKVSPIEIPHFFPGALSTFLPLPPDWGLHILQVWLTCLLAIAGGRTLQYYQYQYPLPWYPLPLQTPGQPQLRDCGLFGCIDDTASSVRQGTGLLTLCSGSRDNNALFVSLLFVSLLLSININWWEWRKSAPF